MIPFSSQKVEFTTNPESMGIFTQPTDLSGALHMVFCCLNKNIFKKPPTTERKSQRL